MKRLFPILPLTNPPLGYAHNSTGYTAYFHQTGAFDFEVVK